MVVSNAIETGQALHMLHSGGKQWNLDGVATCEVDKYLCTWARLLTTGISIRPRCDDTLEVTKPITINGTNPSMVLVSKSGKELKSNRFKASKPRSL